MIGSALKTTRKMKKTKPKEPKKEVVHKFSEAQIKGDLILINYIINTMYSYLYRQSLRQPSGY